LKQALELIGHYSVLPVDVLIPAFPVYAIWPDGSGTIPWSNIVKIHSFCNW